MKVERVPHSLPVDSWQTKARALAIGALAACLWLAGTPAAVAASIPVSVGGGEGSSGVRFDGKTYTNRLIDSNDPYLLQHAHNPVDWYPWGSEAFEKARRENKPIFLSVGYSTCYWCHVAEREIYSNPQIAELMNRWFVNIKVDREQRPDVDRLYMLATQIMTGGGGWPNNVFMTPELKPFFAGSYFPPEDQAGRPGFPTILKALNKSWTEDPSKVSGVAARVFEMLQQAGKAKDGAGEVALEPARWLDEAVKQAAAKFDEMHGGFTRGGTTMFPQQPVLAMLLADHGRKRSGKSLAMVRETLQAIAEGGLMDQLAGGFHRYSTEPSWSIPHFEKMLYDNVQLLGLYAKVHEITKEPFFKQVALRTARYLTGEMQDRRGGFYSAQDAQIDGVEGVSYVWTREQIEAVLGKAEAKRLLSLYELVAMPESHAGQKQPTGGVLRLNRHRTQALAERRELASRLEALAPLRAKLLSARNKRPQPARDEKIVTADNALAILGFLEAGQALKEPSFTRTATGTANWVWTNAFDEKSGLLRHQFYRGRAGDGGFLDDYALLGKAFLGLHASTGDAIWRARAQQLADAMLKRFARPDGSLAMTARESTDLLMTPPAEGDSVRPSGHSAAVALLLGLGANGGDQRYATAARRALAAMSAQVAADPYEWGALLAAFGRPALVAALDGAMVSTKGGMGLPSSADHVRAKARRMPSGELSVAVEIDEGFHINANPASDPVLIPTQVMLDGNAELKVDYPKGKIFKAPFAPEGLAVYSGRVELVAKTAAVDPAPTRVRLRVQACNDQYCLAPATLDVPLRPSD